MKKKTKTDKLNDQFIAYKCMKNDQPPKRNTAKDGSIPTHPVVDCPNHPESTVLRHCLDWLKKHRIMADRHTPGNMPTGASRTTFGIVGAGDIMGALPNGIHFEIETKRGCGGRLSKKQQERQRKLEANNCLYFVVHGQKELEFYFKDLI